MSSYDVVVVGAGAAGIGAGLELAQAGVNFVILEAADRVGGRAFTDASSLPVPWDHGCHWLHCADVNPLVAWADRLGADYVTDDPPDYFTIWQDGRFASAEERQQAQDCTLAAFAAIEQTAGEEHDLSVQDVLPDAGRWQAGVRCIVQMMAGADPELVSAPGYAEYVDSKVNWPVISGYGDLIARMAAELPIRLGVRVDEIAQGANAATLETSAGTLEARAAIVTASTNVLTSGAISFTPGPAAEVLERLNDLPCGIYEKVALAVEGLPPETAGKVFCMIDPGSGQRAIDFQIMTTSPPLMIAHLAGDTVGAALLEGRQAMIEMATERLALAFGSSFRQKVRAAAVTDWTRNPFVRGSYSYARPGAAHQRRKAILADSGNVAFAGEAFSPNWYATAHGAYQSGKDKAQALLRLIGKAESP